MTKNSMPMMGSKLELKQLSKNATGLNSKFHWYGKMMGFTMDFTVATTKWIKDKEKIWGTIGAAQMIIIDWYQMRLVISPEGQNTKTELSIAYTKPKNIFFKFIAFFLAPLYSNWCLNNMLNDSKQFLETTSKNKMINLKPYSASLLTLGGFLIAAMGFYFVFFRQPLLPEDLRYMNSTLSVVQNNSPDLSVWLQKYFWVIGGYIFTTGLLTIYVAQTSFRTRTHGAFIIVLIAGITSIGAMTMVNFILQSDFRFVLLAFTLPWIFSLILYRFHK